MIDTRLSDVGDERERALLRLGAEEAPSDKSVRTAARALGLVPGAAAFAYALGWLAKAAKWSTIGTYVVVPGVVAGIIASGYVALDKRTARPVTVAAAAMVPAQVRVSAPASVEAAPVEREEPSPVVAHRAAARSGARGPAWEVQAQVALVDRARALVRAGDPGGALRVVDEYGRRFPRGVLSEEASLLRIEAVVARGDRVAASDLARRFRAEYPRSVHLDKVQWMVGDGSK